MELQELYSLIGLQPETEGMLGQVSEKVDFKQIDPYLVRLMDRETAFGAYDGLQEILGEDNCNMKMLYCQLECARRAFDGYQEKGIPAQIYTDTMKCFTRFMEECRRKNGQIFFDRGWWTCRQISMALFRIGALEYEFTEYEGEDVIGIHIPSDADLSKEAVDCSLEQAEIFFRTYYGGYQYKMYICDSWLMSSALPPLLSEKSHILSFQKRFEIAEEDKEDKGYMEWLFQVPSDTAYVDLPAVTDLQRKVRELLINGGKVGTACGILRRPILRTM